MDRWYFLNSAFPSLLCNAFLVFNSATQKRMTFSHPSPVWTPATCQIGNHPIPVNRIANYSFHTVRDSKGNRANQVTSKPIIIYPNSGETYDGDRKDWAPSTGVSDEDFVSYVGKWREVGASLIGGCCRTTPNTIRGIYRVLHKDSAALASLS